MIRSVRYLLRITLPDFLEHLWFKWRNARGMIRIHCSYCGTAFDAKAVNIPENVDVPAGIVVVGTCERCVFCTGLVNRLRGVSK